MPALLATADILLVTLRDVPLFATFIPSKMFEYLAAGRPVIGAVAGEAAQILREAGAVVVPPGDSAALAAAIAGLAADPRRARGHGRAGPGLRGAVLRPRRPGPPVPQDPATRAAGRTRPVGRTGEAAGDRGQRLPGRVRAARGGRARSRGHRAGPQRAGRRGQVRRARRRASARRPQRPRPRWPRRSAATAAMCWSTWPRWASATPPPSSRPPRRPASRAPCSCPPRRSPPRCPPVPPGAAGGRGRRSAASALDWTILRPTMIYGAPRRPEPVPAAGRCCAGTPVLPVPGGGRPAAARARGRRGATPCWPPPSGPAAMGVTYDVAGPEPLTFDRAAAHRCPRGRPAGPGSSRCRCRR